MSYPKMTAYCSHFKFEILNQKKLIKLATIFIFYTSEILECFWLDNVISVSVRKTEGTMLMLKVVFAQTLLRMCGAE